MLVSRYILTVHSNVPLHSKLDFLTSMSAKLKQKRDETELEPYSSQFLTGQLYSTRSVLLTLSLAILSLAIVTYSSFNSLWASHNYSNSDVTVLPKNAAQILSQCQALRTRAGPSPNFREREVSDRFDPLMNHNTSYLIKNATILTGEKNGTNVIHGDLLMVNGLIKGMGKNVPRDLVEAWVFGDGEDEKKNLTVIDADGRWVTPGLSE